MDRSANAAPISFCGNLEDVQEMQRLLAMKAELHSGCEFDLAADAPERKRRKAEELECPDAPKKEKTTAEAELADEDADMERAWQELAGRNWSALFMGLVSARECLRVLAQTTSKGKRARLVINRR
eukprot:3945628-Pyramimonas_sp.AAC.1